MGQGSGDDGRAPEPPVPRHGGSAVGRLGRRRQDQYGRQVAAGPVWALVRRPHSLNVVSRAVFRPPFPRFTGSQRALATIGAMNPWLAVPLEDYEGHMGSPAVDQLAPLADLFGEALARMRPRSVAVLGVAGGNGLEHVDSTLTTRVVGVDLNAAYLATTKARFPHLRGLELHCADLGHDTLNLEPVALVHAALFFEHAGTGQCLDTALSLVAEGGHLSV